MRIAYFDCFAGLSGDMTVAALLSAGLPLERLRAELAKLPLTGYQISTRLIERSMISAVKFDVELTDHAHEHHHDSPSHDHEHDAHSHDHHHDHHHDHEHDDHHRHEHEELEIHVHQHGLSYAEIRALINESDLFPRVKQRAQAIFHAIGEAEARIHAVPLGEVHFHEVGAIDSIVDIVSVAIGLEYFDVDECRSRAVPLGNGGMIRTAHGMMPIPTPATLEILKGYPTELGAVAKEMTTPTGAGVIRAMSRGALANGEELEPIAVGYGAGTMEFREIPNLLRIIIGDLKGFSQSSAPFPRTDSVVQLTTAIDDMAPTVLAFVQELLMQKGALDVYLRPILMKKGRPAHELVVLAHEFDAESLLSIIERETTTLGVRFEHIARRTAARTNLVFNHEEFGLIHGKEIMRRGEPQAEIEYEDVKRIAREIGLPFREVHDRLRKDLLE